MPDGEASRSDRAAANGAPTSAPPVRLLTYQPLLAYDPAAKPTLNVTRKAAPPPQSAPSPAPSAQPAPSPAKRPTGEVPVPPYVTRPRGRPPKGSSPVPKTDKPLAHNITVCGRDLVKSRSKIYSRVLSALDDEFILAEILKFKNLTAIAASLKCARSTLQRYIELVPDLKEAYTSIKDSIDDLAEQKLFEKIQSGDLGALMFYMPRRMRHRGYGDEPLPGSDDEQPRVVIGRIPQEEVDAANASLPPPPQTLQKAQVAYLHPEDAPKEEPQAPSKDALAGVREALRSLRAKKAQSKAEPAPSAAPAPAPAEPPKPQPEPAPVRAPEPQPPVVPARTLPPEPAIAEEPSGYEDDGFGGFGDASEYYEYE